MGPYQTLRAHNWWTQLLVRFRVFFEFRKSGNHLNEVHNSRGVFFYEKKPPAGQNRDNEDWRTEFVFTRIPKSQSPRSRISKSQNPQIPKYQIRKFAILNDQTINISRWSLFEKFRNWQIKNFQIDSPLSVDRFGGKKVCFVFPGHHGNQNSFRRFRNEVNLSTSLVR